ncbi:MAG: esterase family protein [Chloroflexi bacterium]|nr:esterase family protein [Chloroflexota bacterium]
MADHPLVEQAQSLGTPLIDGDTATFVWIGETAPELIGDFNDWGASALGSVQMTQVAPEVWTHALTLPSDAYIEYVFTTDPDDPDKSLLDPLNRRQVSNGMGRTNNYFAMPGRQTNVAAEFVSGVPQGDVTRHAIYSPMLLSGNRRDVWLYHPPTDEPAPLIVVYDGKDYFRRANLTQIVANLIATKQIAPVALAMIDNAREDRFLEYNATETVLAQVTELVMPLAYNNLNLIDPDISPGAWGVMGASMGGLMAMYTGLRLPQVFGKVICQSGAFQYDLTDYPPIVDVLVRGLPKAPVRIWQDVGRFEWLLAENRAFNALLNEHGYKVTFREFNGGHNWSSWRDMLPAALSALFPA